MKQFLFAIIMASAFSACNMGGSVGGNTCSQCEAMDAAREHIEQNLEYRLSSFEAMEVKNDERALAIWQRMEAIKRQVKKADSYLVQERSAAHGNAAEHLKGLTKDTMDTILKYSVTDRTSPNDKEYVAQLLAAFYDPQQGPKSFDGTILALAGVQLQLATIYADIMNRMVGHFEFPHGCVLEHIDVISIAEEKHIKLGEEYRAEMFLAIIDPDIPYEMYVEGKKIDIQDARGMYRVKPARPGTYKWVGIVEVPMADGNKKQYRSRELTYTVTK